MGNCCGCGRSQNSDSRNPAACRDQIPSLNLQAQAHPNHGQPHGQPHRQPHGQPHGQRHRERHEQPHRPRHHSYDQKDIDLQPLKNVIDESSELAYSVNEFTQGMVGKLDAFLGDLNSSTMKKAKYDVKAKEAYTDIRLVAVRASKYIQSVEDLFYYGKKVEKVKRGLLCNNYAPLVSFIENLKYCLVRTEEAYEEFDDACRRCCNSCLKAEDHCKVQSRVAESNKVKAQEVGGVAAAGMLVLGVGLSILAGIGTFGAGTVVGLGVAGAGATAGGVATAYVTHNVATGYEEIAKEFKDLGSFFENIYREGSDMKVKITRVKDSIESLANTIDDLERNEQVSPEALYDCLKLQTRKFHEYHRTVSSCQQQLEQKKNCT